METDVVVVGGGVAGLTTATLLAQSGRRVTLVERAPHVGGRATTQAVGGGLFNQGPHALYRNGPAMRVLKKLRVKYTGGVPGVTGNWSVREGRLFPLLAGSLSWPERFELLRVLARVVLVRSASVDSVTLERWLDGVVRSPRVREYVLALTRVSSYSNAPSLASAGAIIRQLRAALRNNVLYVDGGWQTLIDGLEKAAAAAGVEVLTSTSVEAVTCTGGVVRGVVLAGGRTFASRDVVIASSPQVAAALVEGHPALTEWASHCVPVHAACLDVVLEELPMPQHLFALGLDAPHYFSVHSRYAKLGPVKVLQVAKYLPPGDSGADARPELEALVDLMQPGWRERRLEERFLPHMTVMHALPLASRGGTSGRPACSVPGTRGLYVAGDWVGPTAMLVDVAFASAESVAQEIARAAPVLALTPGTKRGLLAA